MPTIKIASNKISINTSGVTSSNVSSSLNGNMNLIKSQIAQKTNDYINVKNAVNILEIYSNWNGYIKLYTEVQSNFIVGDTVYVTYTSSETGTTIFNLENPSIPDEGTNRFYLGYKILYINQFKNEIVINRHYNDIPDGYYLKNQQLSKVSCRGGYLYNYISDGVVFYNCSILNNGFSTISGIITVNNVPIQGVSVTISGTKIVHTTDSNGFYIINASNGDNLIKCYYPGYIISPINVHINSGEKVTKNISMISGNNNITISSDIQPIFGINKVPVCSNNTINFTSTNLGYSQNITYKWFINRLGNNILVGTNNNKLSYNNFSNDDIIYCLVTDNDLINFFTGTTSNMISIDVLPLLFQISADKYTIHDYESNTFYAYSQCYENPTFQWYINNTKVGTNSNVYISDPYSIPNGANIRCDIGTIQSYNIIRMTVI